MIMVITLHKMIHIEDIQAPELDIYARLHEAQLRHYYEPDGGIFIAESARIIARALEAGCQPISILVDERELAGAGEKEEIDFTCDNLQNREEILRILKKYEEIPVYTASEAVLRQITGIHLTKGILCAMRRPKLPAVQEICEGKTTPMQGVDGAEDTDTAKESGAAGIRRIAILEKVENPTNVGAIFRSAAALGVDAILLTQGCSDPYYRRAARVSMGTVFQVPWTYLDGAWPEEGMTQLHALGFKTAAMALDENAVPIDDPRVMGEEKLAIILGSENYGLEEKTVAACDYSVMIPMSHGVDSLNVAAASAVAFWQLCRK